MYKDIIDRLVAYPQRGRMKIDFDVKKKIFRFSMPIFASREMPDCVKNYVEARKNSTFKPHETSFQMDEGKVFLIQEVPFDGGFQETLRKNVDQFWLMSKQCSRMIAEIAVEEQYKDALNQNFH
jgi:hypothetical protein